MSRKRGGLSTKRLLTLVDTLNIQDELRDIRESGYRASERGDYSMAELANKIAVDRRAYEDAQVALSMAQQSGASRYELSLISTIK